MASARDRIIEAHGYLARRQLDRAEGVLRRVLAQNPGDADANASMCLVYAQREDHARALFYIDRALERSPGDPNFLTNRANLLVATGDAERAAAELEGALRRDPGHLGARITLANAYGALERHASALREARAVLSREPENVEALRVWAASLRHMGRSEEAMGLLRQAAARHPEEVPLVVGLATATNYSPGVSAAEAREVHEWLGRLVAARVPYKLEPPPPARGPERTLRVGFLSYDLRYHPVGMFIRPLLENLDREQFHVTCYSTCRYPDALSSVLARASDQWRDAPAVDDVHLAQMARQDRIDILIDLSGHTGGNRLGVFQLRAAPVQMSYLGYPNTTGIRSIEYRIVDAVTDPPGDSEHMAVEKLVRLGGCFVCYRLLEGTPDTKEKPAILPSSPVTFGSFNATQKLNTPMLAVWARLLHSVPGSRLLLKGVGFREPEICEDMWRRWEALGVERPRVELMPPTASPMEHLATYGRVDVALDTFPYNGTTTTCEALAMGVPVVSLRGAMHAGRVGASLLRAAGLGMLLAEDEGEYVRIGVAVARGELAVPRGTALRAHVLASELCDAGAYARRFGEALRGVWRAKCAEAAG